MRVRAHITGKIDFQKSGKWPYGSHMNIQNTDLRGKVRPVTAGWARGLGLTSRRYGSVLEVRQILLNYIVELVM